MNYDRLFSFVVFAEHLNFTRAAQALHLTQPALHAQVRKLSEEVGVALHRRRGRSLELTAEGRHLAAYGREIQARGRELEAELRGQALRGPVILASGQGALLYLLGSAITRFPKHRWPLRVVAMSGPEVVDAVKDARAHLGVAVLATVPADLDVRRIRRVGQRVLLPRAHPLAKRRTLKPSDLDGEALIVAPEGSPHRVMLTQALATAGVQWSVAVEATGWELMIQLARYGLGVAVVNDLLPVPRGLVGVKLEGVPTVEYHVFSRPGAARGPTEVLRRLILEGEG